MRLLLHCDGHISMETAAKMIRSPLRRTSQESKASMPVFRPRRCDQRKGGCGEQFTPMRQMQKACSPSCASAMVGFRKAKDAAKAERDDKRKTRAQLEVLKTIPQLKKEAQTAFNKFVRLRDAHRYCICCDKPLTFVAAINDDGKEDEQLGWSFGGQYDCGHYRSTGAADHLRFNEDNAHAQRKYCNQWRSGNAVEYRIGLVRRIGIARVEALEANNTPIKWTRELLREIRDSYRRKAKELEK